jgi:hypothetical protein
LERELEIEMLQIKFGEQGSLEFGNEKLFEIKGVQYGCLFITVDGHAKLSSPFEYPSGYVCFFKRAEYGPCVVNYYDNFLDS